MSSRVFKATTSHTATNPQLCGLTGTPIVEGDWCFYLVCAGKDARPEFQINVVREEEYTYRGRKQTRKIRETPDGRPFFSVFTGEWETYTKPDGTQGKRRKYEWQTENAQGARIPVTVWSNMVLASAAEKLGYNVPRNGKGKFITTKAHKGDRTVGFEHRHGEEEPAMVTIAKAALSDEDAGVVPPKDETPVSVGASDEATLASALGLTIEQYRSLSAE
jgi:hypothetical protein